jgi:hypothetical protein
MERSERAGDVLKRFFEYHNLGAEGQRYVSFFRSWEKMAGIDLAAHSQVSDIRNHVAIVDVDHPAWMQVLQMKQSNILRRIQEHHADLEIRAIHMRLIDRAQWNRTVTASVPAQPSRVPEPETPKPMNPPPGEAVDAVNDERLKSALSRLKEQVVERDRARDKNR